MGCGCNEASRSAGSLCRMVGKGELIRMSTTGYSPLKKIFNRDTLKLSYSCMPNIKNAIDKHNKSQLHSQQDPTKNCNCRDKPNCPLNGKCREKGIIYQATVTTKDNEHRPTTEEHRNIHRINRNRV